MRKFVAAFFMMQIIMLHSYDCKISESQKYFRITDSIIEDIDNDGIDEIILSSYGNGNKFIDIYRVINGELRIIDTTKVPELTVFFDAGDIDNDGFYDVAFLTSNGLYYKRISLDYSETRMNFVPNVRSEIVAEQPELLSDVNMIMDMDNDGKNEFVIENIRAVEVYETVNFSRLVSINLQTVLEYSIVPGQFYPQYIFYTLPFILIIDIDNDGKKEIITKFPRTINIFSQKSINSWQLKRQIRIAGDNVYFLSNSFVKFSYPVVSDIDNDDMKEIIVSTANLDLPKLRFEAIGDVYYFTKSSYGINNNKRISVKGIPLNLPLFFNLSDPKYKDFILPSVPFNLFSIFSLLSGDGSVDVPFMYYRQNKDNFELNKGKKLFEIQLRIENITSFIEEMPFDFYSSYEFPDFYYFTHNFKKKTADILFYSYNSGKKSFITETIATVNIPGYTPELPAILKLGKFSGSLKKGIIFITRQTMTIISRVD